MKKTVTLLALISCSSFSNAEWKCINSDGNEYTVSQRSISDTCTNTETGEKRTPGDTPAPKPFKSNPKKAQQAMSNGKKAVLANLKDPESAKFNGLYTAKDAYLCGEVNARNSFGGYVGYKRFVTLGSPGLTWIDDGSADFLEKVAEFCHGMTRQQINDITGR